MSQMELTFVIFGTIIIVYIFVLIIKSFFKTNKESDVIKKSKERNQKKVTNEIKKDTQKKDKPLPTMAGTKK